MILRGGEPFLLPGGDHGVLLVHGFTGAPAEMLLLGQYLHKQGYTVLAVRLAGHGTTPEALAQTTYDDWYDSLCDGYSILASMCQHISVVGQSMGGLLSLLLAADGQVEKVVTLAAPIFIHEDRQLYRLPAREKCGCRYYPKKRRNIADVPPECNVSYGEMPMISIHEVLDLIDRAKKELPRLRCPLLVVQSHEDHTVRDRSGSYIYTYAGSYEKEIMWLEKSGHLVSLGCDREAVFEKIAEFLQQPVKE